MAKQHRNTWLQTLYIFSGGMAVWFGLMGMLALHG
jgi:hypothetical protein